MSVAGKNEWMLEGDEIEHGLHMTRIRLTLRRFGVVNVDAGKITKAINALTKRQRGEVRISGSPSKREARRCER